MVTVPPAFPLKNVSVPPLFAFWKGVEPNSLTVGGGAKKSWGEGQTTWVWINGHCAHFFPLLKEVGTVTVYFGAVGTVSCSRITSLRRR